MFLNDLVYDLRDLVLRVSSLTMEAAFCLAYVMQSMEF